MMGTTMGTIRFAIHGDPDRYRTAIGIARTRSKIAKGLTIPVTMSLSSINQDLHWKLQQQQRLQQQRLGVASMFSGVGGENEQQNQIVLDSQAQKLRPITFQNMETSKPSQTEWFNRKHMG
ncbi:hypothetical protein Tco_0362106 [Tanacetum coccineum]